MKNDLKMKRGGAFALALIASLSLFIVAACQGQVPTFNYTAAGGPRLIPAATTTNLASPVYIDCSRSQILGLSCSANWSTAGEFTGNTNLIYSAGPSLDGITYSTNENVISFVAYNRAAAGGNSITMTNVNVGAYQGYYVFKIVNNSAAGVATNTLTYGQKISSP